MPGGKGGADVDFNTRDIIEMTPGINAGGLDIYSAFSGPKAGGRPRGDGGGFGFEITGGATPERQNAVRSLSSAFGQKADEFASLRSEVRPGFGRLTKSRLQGLEDERRRRIGDVSQELSRRRILGSNFARDELSREDLAFTREKDRIRSESYLSELAASVDLVGQEYDARALEHQTTLDEMNLEANVALSLATGAQQVYGNLKGQAMQLEAEAKQQSSGGINSLVGNIIGAGVGIGSSYLQAPQQLLLNDSAGKGGGFTGATGLFGGGGGPSSSSFGWGPGLGG